MLDVSEKGLAFVAVREACVLTAYQDTRHLALGFGINDPSLKEGDTITLDEAITRYVKTAGEYSASINKILLGLPIKQHQHDVLFSVTWNIGATRLADEDRLLRAIRAHSVEPTNPELRDWAAYELLHVRWDLVGHKPFNLARRCAEAILYVRGDYGDLSKLKLWREGKNPRRDPVEEIPMPTFRKTEEVKHV